MMNQPPSRSTLPSRAWPFLAAALALLASGLAFTASRIDDPTRFVLLASALLGLVASGAALGGYLAAEEARAAAPVRPALADDATRVEADRRLAVRLGMDRADADEP